MTTRTSFPPAVVATLLIWGLVATGGCKKSEDAAASGDNATKDAGASADQGKAGSDSADAGTVDIGPSEAPNPQVCDAYAKVTQAGKLSNSKLDELSGLAASRIHDDILWTHNDSGEKKPRIYAINSEGLHVATWLLKGVSPVDWEDIATGPCAGNGPLAKLSCVYVADVGDNSHKRDEVMIHRVSEPDEQSSRKGDRERREKFRKSATESFSFSYPKVPDAKDKDRKAEEHPDVEAMAVLPDARVILLTKRDDGRAKVFRVDLSKSPVEVVELGMLDLRDDKLKQGHSLRATAADLDKTGRYLLVRSYFRIYVFDVGKALMANPVTARATLANAPRQSLTAGLDLQGEAIAWAADGGVWHTSEGNHQPLWKIPCAKPAAGK